MRIQCGAVCGPYSFCGRPRDDRYGATLLEAHLGQFRSLMAGSFRAACTALDAQLGPEEPSPARAPNGGADFRYVRLHARSARGPTRRQRLNFRIARRGASGVQAVERGVAQRRH